MTGICELLVQRALGSGRAGVRAAVVSSCRCIYPPARRCTFAVGSRMIRRGGANIWVTNGRNGIMGGTIGIATAAPAPAPLPAYQRQYSGDRYPKAERQSALQNQNYRYQPHEQVARPGIPNATR